MKVDEAFRRWGEYTDLMLSRLRDDNVSAFLQVALLHVVALLQTNIRDKSELLAVLNQELRRLGLWVGET